MTPLDPDLGITIQNDSGETIPGRSLVVAVSVETVPEDDDNEAYTFTHVTKYSGQKGNIMVTGPVSIANGAKGLAFFDQFLYVNIDPAAANPNPGETWGPVSGKWEAGPSGSGFIAQGYSENGGDPKRAMFYRESTTKRGVTNITFIIVSAGATTCLGKVISWEGDGTIEDIPGDINHLAGIATALGVVQVCDAQGCVFDEPPDQLFGRIGSATYRNVNVAGVCRSGYGPWEPVWEADTLCCKKPTCAFLGGT